MNKRWINTKVEFIWDGSQYVEQSSNGYWYDGEMALADYSNATAVQSGNTTGTFDCASSDTSGVAILSPGSTIDPNLYLARGTTGAYSRWDFRVFGASATSSDTSTLGIWNDTYGSKETGFCLYKSNVGIGIYQPTTPLFVSDGSPSTVDDTAGSCATFSGDGTNATGYIAQVSIQDNTPATSGNGYGQNFGGSISFGAVTKSSITRGYQLVATISGKKETATDGAHDGYLQFVTRKTTG